ncbi:MAG: hypothetical protein F6K18_06395 [Okeania sp. SIO2C2]|uniref:hypothetical protein n=1 Tax=Okeania sp. SIO2C2 TaxID=2607787 RepID=UPI0013BA3986|nr:hypothetical protein [Okeania sp. SIO2C2]NEP86484.1 hypothetical protein [Okeania sp. SIO2C2]
MEIYAYHQVAVTWETSHKIEQPRCFSCDRIIDFLRLGWKALHICGMKYSFREIGSKR